MSDLPLPQPKQFHTDRPTSVSYTHLDVYKRQVLINIEDYAKYEEFMHQRYVAEELAKAKQQAADPNTQWADHESVWETLPAVLLWQVPRQHIAGA